MGLDLAFFFVAIKTTTIANAAVIGSLQPLVLLLVSSRWFGERISKRLIAMTLLAVAGTGLVILGSAGQPAWSLRGDGLSVLAMLAFAAYFAFAKKARQTVPLLEFQTSVWIAGWVTLLPVAIFTSGATLLPEGTNWLWLLLLVAVPGTGHFLMNWAHSRLPLSATSIITLGIPVISVLIAKVFLDIPITSPQLWGMAVALASLAAILRYQTKPAPAS